MSLFNAASNKKNAQSAIAVLKFFRVSYLNFLFLNQEFNNKKKKY